MNKISVPWGRQEYWLCLLGIQKSPWLSPYQMKINPEEAPARHAVVFSLIGALWDAEGCQRGCRNIPLDTEHSRFDSPPFFFISVKAGSWQGYISPSTLAVFLQMTAKERRKIQTSYPSARLQHCSTVPRRTHWTVGVPWESTWLKTNESRAIQQVDRSRTSVQPALCPSAFWGSIPDSRHEMDNSIDPQEYFHVFV